MISVIIPVFNGEKYIKNCIDSVLKQTINDFEVIIVNDGSNDKTLEIIKKLQEKDDRIKIYSMENSGVSKARNLGIKNAKGDYIVFIDSDDCISKNYLEEMVKNQKDKCLVRCYKKNSIENIEKFKIKILTGEYLGVCWGYLFITNNIKTIFDEKTSFMEDTIFISNYIVNNKIDKVININSCKYIKNENELSLTANNKFSKNRLYQYLYSLDRIKSIFNLQSNNVNKKLEKRFLKILESEFSNINNKKYISEILADEKLLAKFSNLQYFHLQYCFFVFLYKNKRVNGCWNYIHIRNSIKKVVKLCKKL